MRHRRRHETVKLTRTHGPTLNYATKNPRQAQTLVVGSIVFVILAVTLLPSGSEPRRPFSFCLTCDFRWLTDTVLNVALFVPLGFAAGWRAKSPWKVAIAGALFSTAIELLQMAVPGRDPALRDILSNAAGAALGVALAYRPRAWLLPNDRPAAWLAGITAVVILAVCVSTAMLLAPVRTQESMSVFRAENDAVVSYQSHADAIGLDQPSYYVRDMFVGETTADPIQVDVSRRWTGWCVHVGSIGRCRIGPTVGRGWSVLMYPSVIAHRWADGLLDIVWIAALFFPLGFWTRRSGVALSTVAAIVLLAIVPSVVGLVPTTVGEWLAAAASMIVGFVIARALRNRYVPQVRELSKNQGLKKQG